MIETKCTQISVSGIDLWIAIEYGQIRFYEDNEGDRGKLLFGIDESEWSQFDKVVNRLVMIAHEEEVNKD